MTNKLHKERNHFQLALINRGGKGAHKDKKKESKNARKQKHKKNLRGQW